MLKPATNSDDDPSFEDAPKTSSGNSAREKTKKSWHFTLQIGVKNAYHHIMSPACAYTTEKAEGV